MELELRSVEHQGAHEARPTLVDRVWAPDVYYTTFFL